MGKPVEACHSMVGLRVRQIREAIGITQGDLAKRVGLDRTSIANAETGRQRFLLDTVERYARALGTTPKALMKGIWW
jgi:transcriptional regulator with XRE-family HTH domain